LVGTLQAKITGYSPKNGCFKTAQGEFRVLREFNSNGKKEYLVVDTATLNSGVYLAKNIKLGRCDDSKYQRLLNASAKPPYPLQNDGIRGAKEGVFITTDLCPSSKKGFEKRLYEGLIRSFPNPVPVTLFITKRWIEKHKKAFGELKQWQRAKKLSITWGNHTAYHHYHPKVPLKQNFVLSPEENLSKDILDLELELLKNGITPSVFFRFPGLVSDKKSIELVKSLGLISIGSNCWIAKGQKVKNGSIILVHGNRNEPRGVEMLLRAIESGKIREVNSIKEIELR
jgi:hypothetical protein